MVIRGLREVQEMMRQIANMTGSPAMAETVWQMGEETRRQCRLMCIQVVYSSPESRNYKRTGYLRESIYLTMRGRTDRAEVQAHAFAFAQATYPNRASNAKTYRMRGHIPHRSTLSVRVVAGAQYADFVEFGTENMGPRPFMRAGSDAGSRAITGVGERAISQFLSAASKGRAAGRVRDVRGRFV